jgi:hypothetical protein
MVRAVDDRHFDVVAPEGLGDEQPAEARADDRDAVRLRSSALIFRSAPSDAADLRARVGDSASPELRDRRRITQNV